MSLLAAVEGLVVDLHSETAPDQVYELAVDVWVVVLDAEQVLVVVGGQE
jgi:hypothetical protein